MNAVFDASYTFPVGASTLFEVLVARVGDWWGGAVTAFEPVAGGRLAIGDERGVVRKVDPPHRLTLELGETLAMLLLSEGAEGTRLQVLHSRFASGPERDEYAARWDARAARIRRSLSPAG